jgi:uroporphyrin-III C-methyltransferase
MPKGSLVVVGTGIQAAGQITVEARNAIQRAEKLIYLVTEPIAKQYLVSLNPNAESLEDYYDEGKDRFTTYMEMVDRIVGEVHKGTDLCVAFYGHPGVFVLPSHEAIRRLRDEGYYAKMLPGVSAEDCLFADIGLDPALPGCQSFEATGFLLNKWRFEPRCSLILWQIGVIGVTSYQNVDYSPQNLDVLADYLSETYGPDHNVIIYEAPFYPIHEPIIQVIPLSELQYAKISPISTLYVPPLKGAAEIDQTMLRRLGMNEQSIHSMELKIYANMQVREKVR